MALLTFSMLDSNFAVSAMFWLAEALGVVGTVMSAPPF